MVKKTVLLVDDGEINRTVLRKIMESEYKIIEAADGDECLQILETRLSEISLVVLDVWMPRMDGFTVLREIEKNGWRDRVPVIVATADTSEETEVKLLDLGAMDVLRKPYKSAIVLRKARNAIHWQEQYFKGKTGTYRTVEFEDKNLLNCMGSFLYAYNWADGTEHMDPYYTKLMPKEWNRFTIKAPEQIRSLVYRPDYENFEAFLKQQDLSDYKTIDVRLMSANGLYEWFRVGMTKYMAKTGEQTAVVFSNVTVERKAKARLEFLATHDPLTQILNQTAFTEQVKTLQKRFPGRTFSMLHLAIDRFYIMNQLYGKSEGDQVLKYLAVKLQESVEAETACLCCRLHGDQFAAFGTYDDEKVNDLKNELQEAMDIYPLKFTLTISIGVYHANQGEVSVESMLDMAEKAQRTVSNNYSLHVAYYNTNLRASDEAERMIALEMGEALRGGQLHMFLQPKCNMETGAVIGSEALVRWKHPKRGLIPPGCFIPVMEGNGFISQLDHYMLEQACLYQRRWLDEKRKVYPISVNVSRADLYNSQLLKSILSLVDGYSLPHDLIEFELTESSFVVDNAKMRSLAIDLQKHGFRILMDDFGSGYSSLNSLKDIDVDVLKIDLKFLQDSDENPRALQILKSVIRMAQEINIETIIEGVETKEQVDFLKSLGVMNAQGYFYYHPMPVHDFEKLLIK